MTKETNKRKVDDSAIADCTSAFKKMALSATATHPVASDETEPQRTKSRQKTRSWRRKTQSRQVDSTKTQSKTNTLTISLGDQISAMLKIIRAETESEIQAAPTPATSFVDVRLASADEQKLSRKMSKNAQERKADNCLDEKGVSEEQLSSKTDGLGVEAKSSAEAVNTATSTRSPAASSVGTHVSSENQKKLVRKSKQISRKRARRSGPDMSSKRTKSACVDDGMLDRLVRLFAKLAL
ncbi:uncharacterized protein LOC133171742 isoform X2 [Saccostrea echinata]|uniref:uncharacterized protein LOC133171742 isoform X2 n=1 Tax=Saccostrea echinata TaxID=191078 RepID=UPI002A7FE652|nr:uncharacterized protein LOC133171742 isoform X2 [Saccostrea echinata]